MTVRTVSTTGILLSILSLSALLSGCENDSPSGLVADPGPVVDRAPYLCDMVPEPSFRQVTGLKGALVTAWAGPQADNGLCLVRAAEGKPPPLGLDWSYQDGANAIQLQRQNWKQESPRSLPADLGEGLAIVRPTAGAEARPNFVIALFRCGEKRPWISIDFVSVVRGRDAVQDMFDFMRIAEKRFGEIHKCTPRPS